MELIKLVQQTLKIWPIAFTGYEPILSKMVICILLPELLFAYLVYGIM